MLGPRIAALRRRAGLSQSELAQRLQISPSAIGMYEQGRREPSVAMLLALGRELEVSMDFLLKGAASPPEQTLPETLLEGQLAAALSRMAQRKQPPFTARELKLLLEAMLTEEDA